MFNIGNPKASGPEDLSKKMSKSYVWVYRTPDGRCTQTAPEPVLQQKTVWKQILKIVVVMRFLYNVSSNIGSEQ